MKPYYHHINSSMTNWREDIRSPYTQKKLGSLIFKNQLKKRRKFWERKWYFFPSSCKQKSMYYIYFHFSHNCKKNDIRPPFISLYLYLSVHCKWKIKIWSCFSCLVDPPPSSQYLSFFTTPHNFLFIKTTTNLFLSSSMHTNNH